MALSPDTLPPRPMVPDPSDNVADHYLKPAETTFPPDFQEPEAYVLDATEWEIFSARRARIAQNEAFEAEHTGNQWS